MTASAEALVRQIRDNIHDVEQELRNHPFAQAFSGGRAPVEAIRPFVSCQHHIAQADTRSAALMVHRFDETPAGGFCRGFLLGGMAALQDIPVMAAKAGLGDADLQAYEPSPQGFAYPCYVTYLASQGSAAEILCGFLVNLPAWGFNCGEVGRGLREHHGWNRDDTRFVDAMAELPAFDEEALPVIQAGLDSGEEPARIARVARLIQAYEKLFWDAMAEEAGLG